MKTEFETYKTISGYDISNLKREEPNSVNFLSYRRTKITVELIDEPKEVLISRLEYLLSETKGFTSRQRIIDEIKKLSK